MSRVCAAIVAAAVGMTLSSRAAACDDSTRDVPSAVVHVRSRSSTSLGVVVVAPDLVLVPSDVVSVERPWEPDAKVTDAAGKVHDAVVVAFDAALGLALLHVGARLSEAPMAVRDGDDDAACTRSIEGNGGASLVPFDGLPDPSMPFPTRGRSVWSRGAPIIDDRGALVGVVALDDLVSPARPTTVDLAHIQRFLAMRSSLSPDRPRLRVHGGAGLVVETTPGAGVWGGVGVHVSARVRDITELRLDGALTFLWPSNAREGGCVEGCAGGVRGTLTPSIGTRITLANASDPWNVTLTPSMGLAMGVQYADSTGTSYDAASPSSFVLAAPGVGVSLGPAEARARLRLPAGGFSRETWELGVGVDF